MAIPKFLEDLRIISKLGDNPGADNGLSSSGLREKFDEAGVKIQQYINNTLIPALSGLANPEEGLNMKNNIVMGGHRVTGLGNPQDDGDAVPLGYANRQFAPAGYGLGGYSQGLGSWANLDNIRSNGWYYWQSDLPINAPAEWCDMFVSAQKDHIFQIIMPFGKRGCIITRTMIGNDAIVEWMNPPMNLNEEYRTTKRYKGKPVYAKLVDYGNLPNTNIDYRNINASGVIVDVVSCTPTFYDANGLSYGGVIFEVDKCFAANYGQIAIKTNADASSMYAHVAVEYTME